MRDGVKHKESGNTGVHKTQNNMCCYGDSVYDNSYNDKRGTVSEELCHIFVSLTDFNTRPQ